jgi:nanoRNase/pAp phosphatase (c-di-AMP/oligoRNAs hydrolase)
MTTTTAFVESCKSTAAGKAAAVNLSPRGRPRAKKLLKILADKKNILVTTHQHPDPDALASSMAMVALLKANLHDAEVRMSIKGRIGGGVNDAFTHHAQLNLIPWEEYRLGEFDAIILLDVQPGFAYSPLPPGVMPTAIVDHHRAPGRKPQSEFCDIRTDVGASCSIVFSYFM